MVKRVRHNLTESGIYFAEDKMNVIVSCSQLSGMEFNNEFDNSYFFKTYDEKPSLVPFSLLVRMRHQKHHLNVDERINGKGDTELKPGNSVVCLNLNMYGIMGKVVSYDQRRQLFKLAIDKQEEESKVHDPFLGVNLIKDMQKNNKEKM